MSLITELKRRNVFRVGVAYGLVAWLLVEVASVVLPTFKAPEWVMQVFTQLARVREMERNGELAAIPELAAAAL